MFAARPSQRDGEWPGTVSSPDFRDALSQASTAVTIVATNGPFGLAGLPPLTDNTRYRFCMLALFPMEFETVNETVKVPGEL